MHVQQKEERAGTADEKPKNGSESRRDCNSLTYCFAEVSSREGVKVVSKISMCTNIHFPPQAFKQHFKKKLSNKILITSYSVKSSE